MRAYNKALRALERNKYTKGRFVGDAPVSARSRTHLRYIDQGSHIAARAYYTDVFKLYPDGRIVFDSNGWFNSRATRDFVTYVMPGRYFYSSKYKSKRVFVVSTIDGIARVYDGMEFVETDAGLQLLSEPKPFTYQQVDRVATKALREKVKLVYDMAALMIAAGDPGPFPFVALCNLHIEGMFELSPEDIERYARGLVYAVKREKVEVSLKSMREIFNKATTVRKTVTGPEFLGV